MQSAMLHMSNTVKFMSNTLRKRRCDRIYSLYQFGRSDSNFTVANIASGRHILAIEDDCEMPHVASVVFFTCLFTSKSFVTIFAKRSDSFPSYKIIALHR